MKNKRRQILFIEHILWGGGQEKITHRLAHLLDPHIFETHVAYLNYRENVPVKFDPSISVYCLDPAVRNKDLQVRKHQSKILKIRHNILRLIPERVKSLIKRVLRRHTIETFSNDKLDISYYLPIYQNYLSGLRDILSRMDEDALVVSFQEAPTVLAWLNRIYASNKYISFLCVPESIYLPILFPDANRYQFEKWMFGNACRSANRVTVPNDWIREDMQNIFSVPSSIIQKIHNPIDCASILRQSESEVDFGSFPQPRTIFVQLARLDAQKNHDLTVEACEILRQRYNDFVVYLIGDGSEKKRIQKRVVEKKLQNHVVFLGALENPYPYLKKARSSILTSSFEASPLALVESMYLGAVPVSVDCIAGPAEQLGNGRYGLLTPPNDPIAFADAMYRIANDDALWSQLRLDGMKHAENYDISNFIDIWQEMLLKIDDE